MSEPDGASTPDWDQYCEDPQLAVAFENMILYAMCRDNPGHADPYVTAGKTIAIGRIYAASPERGAGTGRSPGSLGEAIGRRLAENAFGDVIEGIDFAERLSIALLDRVETAHTKLTEHVRYATSEWSADRDKDESWHPREHASFSSKYLHFHRPNAFPIMDKFAKAGLACAGIKGPFKTYAQFCRGVLEFVGDREQWTPRSIDKELVARGRVHSDREPSHCACCNARFIKRPRMKGGKKRRSRDELNVTGQAFQG